MLGKMLIQGVVAAMLIASAAAVYAAAHDGGLSPAAADYEREGQHDRD